MVGLLLGGDLLDGFAGGTRENTEFESTLLYGGFWIGLGSLCFSLCLVIVLAFKKIFQKPTSEIARIFYFLGTLLIFALLLLASMFLFSWGIW
jgi:hypothetical protein